MSKFTKDAKRAVREAIAEAKRRGDEHVGTEHLLLALAPTIGLDPARAAGAIRDLDAQALASIGVEVALDPPVRFRRRRHLPLTAGARQALIRAFEVALQERSRRITTRHLALAVLENDHPDPAAQVLVAAGIDLAEARRRLAA